jgi:hypothetical protein
MVRQMQTNSQRAIVSLPRIERGLLQAYFIFDVADTIDLAKLQSADFQRAPLDLRAVASSGHIQFSSPPLVLKLAAPTLDGITTEARAKLYDYGTVAVRLSLPFTGEWHQFAEFGRKWRQSESLLQSARDLLSKILEQIRPFANKPHPPLLEDYFVYEVEAFSPAVTAAELLSTHRGELASLISGEEKRMSASEEDEALRSRFSYFESDLTVIQWDAALIYDSGDGAQAVENILEFANTQLVELRTYDARLDTELDAIYRWEIARHRPQWLFKRGAILQETDRLRALLVDIRELSDRSNNSLKIMGDAFYARLYRGAALRLGLSDWQQQVDSKLESVGEIYRFANDQAQHHQSEFLEFIIIALIVMEIAIAVFGVGVH